MPWKIQRNHGDCKGYAVVSTTSGKVHGCHPTKERARQQQKALYARGVASVNEDTLIDMSASTTSKSRMSNGLWYFIGPNANSTSWATTSSEGTFAITAVENEDVEEEAQTLMLWEGILGIEGKPTDDRRYLIPGEISERELPLSLMVQTVTDEGHKGAQLGARIDEIWRVEADDGSIEIWGRGPFDSSEFGQEAARLVEEEFLTGVSLDLAITEEVALDPETFDPVDLSELDLAEILTLDILRGIKGIIMGATLVPFQAFSEAKVSVVTAGGMTVLRREFTHKDARESIVLTASAAPLKPPKEWFEDPRLTELTPLTITKDGRVFGHLADWDGCHIGFQGICVPPFRSQTNYAYFNTGSIETQGGDLVSCGKIMFCRNGNGHADLKMTADEASRYYDDATKVGAFVRAGSDRFGTWLAGALRSDLDDLEVQHLRTHPPSGDWRPIKGGPSELIAAFAVPIGGFPIQRNALVASANGEISAIITAPLVVGDEYGYRRRRRKKIMLAGRVKDALGHKPSSRRRMREAAMQARFDAQYKNWYVEEFKDYPAATRKRMAKAGTAMPDGSYPIADCEDVANARQAIGRSAPSRRAAVRAHISKRANALGCSAR